MKKFDDKGNRLPLDSKYAPVSTNHDGFVVSAFVAKKLKEIGFHELVLNFYWVDNDGSFRLNRNKLYDDYNKTEQFYSAPTLYQVKEWFKSNGIIINVLCKSEGVEVADGDKTFVVRKATGQWYRVIYSENTYNGVTALYRSKAPINDFENEESALAIAIKDAMSIYIKKLKAGILCSRSLGQINTKVLWT